MKFVNKGFTLIELLIVIALLGALAVGLLAALDPFEQLKKGTDTGIRNTVSEIHGAAIRFYAIKNYMPWCNPAAPTTCTDVSTAMTATALNATDYTPITAIVNAGELKTEFINLAGTQLDRIYVSGVSEPSPEIVVCFMPTSKSFQVDPNTKFKKNGDEGSEGTGTCKSQLTTGADNCYWCIR